MKDQEILQCLQGTFNSLSAIADEGHEQWMVAYSGGKDSTLVAILTLLFLQENENVDVKPRVIYSDTLLEMPPLREAADALLHYMRRQLATSPLNLRVDVVEPAVKDRFWVRFLGRGYPPPGPRFRWCTHRLKIRPADRLLNEDSDLDTAVLTGVRYGESASRKRRLTASCANGGECGQDYWYTKGPEGSNRSYYAPIIDWRTCKVWDFLAFVAPELGWPTKALFKLYGAQDLRFGCWTCTLVREDKTMKNLMNRPEMGDLKKLHDFRNFMEKLGRDKTRRVTRPDGKPGPMDMVTRRELLAELVTLQAETGRKLISKEELSAIEREWKRISWRNENTGGI